MLLFIVIITFNLLFLDLKIDQEYYNKLLKDLGC